MISSFPTLSEMLQNLYKRPIVDREFDFFEKNWRNIKSKEQLTYNEIVKAQTYIH